MNLLIIYWLDQCKSTKIAIDKVDKIECWKIINKNMIEIDLLLQKKNNYKKKIHAIIGELG